MKGGAAGLSAGVVLLFGAIILFGRSERPSCLERAVFGPPSESPYLLPYAVGTKHEVFQTYCGPQSHGRDDQMSINFLMPVGTDVLAAQSGVVRVAVDEHPDFGREIRVSQRTGSRRLPRVPHAAAVPPLA